MRMEMDMVIACVEARRAIWDASSKDHSNRDIIKKLWAEMGTILDIPIVFKSISDFNCLFSSSIVSKQVIIWQVRLPRVNGERCEKTTERNSLKRGQSTGQAAGDKWKSKWTHFEDLSFLQDQFTPHVMTGSMGTPRQEDEKLQNNQEIQDEIFSRDQQEEEPPLYVGMESLGVYGSSNVPSPSEKLPSSLRDRSTIGSTTTSKAVLRSLLQQMVQLEERKVSQY
uniref:(California timema) hypothetical protein n=1 Tax=Timema californicum TaxID=61474 RepID=A0A7R9JGH0_TIMCA|nr:unnamed protein product [Timema californicum]